jgi:hypothetical protein
MYLGSHNITNITVNNFGNEYRIENIFFFLSVHSYSEVIFAALLSAGVSQPGDHGQQSPGVSD